MSEPWSSRPRRSSIASQGDPFSKREPGSICWLKKKGKFKDDVEGTAELPEGCYGHPAVLLWTEGSGAKAAIFTITSFGEERLDIRHPNNRLIREWHLPISPSPPHPDSGLLLEIHGERLQKDSYVKIEEVRICTIRALRPHGNRKLTTRSYELLMQHAPPKPPNADTSIAQRHPRQAPRHTEASRPSWIENAPSLVQDQSPRRPHDYPQNRGRPNNTNPTYTQSPRQYYSHNLRTEQRDALRQSFLHPYPYTPITARGTEYTYGTFWSQNQTSRFPAQPSRHSEPPSSGDKFPYRKVCMVILLLCLGGAGFYGLFVLAKALIAMISQWIHNLLSGKVGAIVRVSFRTAKFVTSMIRHGFRT